MRGYTNLVKWRIAFQKQSVRSFDIIVENVNRTSHGIFHYDVSTPEGHAIARLNIQACGSSRAVNDCVEAFLLPPSHLFILSERKKTKGNLKADIIGIDSQEQKPKDLTPYMHVIEKERLHESSGTKTIVSSPKRDVINRDY